MIEVEVRNVHTGEHTFCWGYSVSGAMKCYGFNTEDWEMVTWDYID